MLVLHFCVVYYEILGVWLQEIYLFQIGAFQAITEQKATAVQHGCIGQPIDLLAGACHVSAARTL